MDIEVAMTYFLYNANLRKHLVTQFENETDKLSEEWTGNKFQEIQKSLNKDVKPILIKLFSDKSPAGSWGNSN